MNIFKAAIAAAGVILCGAAGSAQHVHRAMTMPAPASLYAAPLHLTDAQGHRISVERLRGHPVIATMFFASCPDACPLLTEQVKRLYLSVPPAQRSRLRVLEVSFDPENDSPTVLRAYATQHGIVDARWTLAVADPATAQHLAATLGIEFRRLDRGSFIHVPAVDLIAPNGVILARLPSASLTTPLAAAAVKGLMAE